jgi:hypothetical protein
MEEVLLEGAPEITGTPVTKVYRPCMQIQMEISSILPAYFAEINGMQDRLQRYRAVCENISSQVHKPHSNIWVSGTCIIISQRLLKILRYCLLSLCIGTEKAVPTSYLAPEERGM